jgi:hypothetical protein
VTVQGQGLLFGQQISRGQLDNNKRDLLGKAWFKRPCGA